MATFQSDQKRQMDLDEVNAFLTQINETAARISLINKKSQNSNDVSIFEPELAGLMKILEDSIDKFSQNPNKIVNIMEYLVETQNNQAIDFLVKKKFEQAKLFYTFCKEVANQKNFEIDFSIKISVYNNLGNCLQKEFKQELSTNKSTKLGDENMLIKYLKEAKNLIEDKGTKEGLCSNLLNFSYAMGYMKDYFSSLNYAKQALEAIQRNIIMIKYGTDENFKEQYKEEFNFRENSGKNDTDQSNEYLKKQYNLLILTNFKIGEEMVHLNNVAAAKKMFQKCINIYHKLDIKKDSWYKRSQEMLYKINNGILKPKAEHVMQNTQNRNENFRPQTELNPEIQFIPKEENNINKLRNVTNLSIQDDILDDWFERHELSYQNENSHLRPQNEQENNTNGYNTQSLKPESTYEIYKDHQRQSATYDCREKTIDEMISDHNDLVQDYKYELKENTQKLQDIKKSLDFVDEKDTQKDHRNRLDNAMKNSDGYLQSFKAKMEQEMIEHEKEHERKVNEKKIQKQKRTDQKLMEKTMKNEEVSEKNGSNENNSENYLYHKKREIDETYKYDPNTAIYKDIYEQARVENQADEVQNKQQVFEQNLEKFLESRLLLGLNNENSTKKAANLRRSLNGKITQLDLLETKLAMVGIDSS